MENQITAADRVPPPRFHYPLKTKQEKKRQLQKPATQKIAKTKKKNTAASATRVKVKTAAQ